MFQHIFEHAHTLLIRAGEKIIGWGEALVLMLPNLLAALLILVLASLLSRVMARVARRLVGRSAANQALSDLVGRMVKLVVIATGVIVALQILELDKAATTFLAGAGILGLAVGFAFQDLTANFIAGVALAARRPMRVGDLVETNKLFGRVEAIRLRTTSIRKTDGKLVMIPNRRIFEEPLINYTDQGALRLDLECGVSYAEDLDAVRKAVFDAVCDLDRDDSHDVDVFFTEFGSSSINFVVRMWVRYRGQRDLHAARSAALMSIKRTFDDRGITIPFPIRTLDFGIRGGANLREQLSGDGSGSEDAQRRVA